MADRAVTGAQRADPAMRVVAPPADPLAELARLRRPTGPWLHLLDGAPSDARQLGWMLQQDGVVMRILRGHCGRTAYGLFDEAAAALQLPGDPVEDWPALAGLLTDMSWLPGEGHLLVVTRAALLLAAAAPSELDGFVTAVREVARGRAEEGEPVPFHVVLQDDVIGLASLRPRLEAAGARYDELTGWDAEEPVAAVSVSSRTGYEQGGPALDGVDRAVVGALSTWDGVVAVRRCWEVFRGPDVGRVRVYVPVFAEPPAGPVLRGLVGAVSIAAGHAGAAALAVPLGADEGRWDPRQRVVAEAAVELWPNPEPVREPEPAPATPAAAAADPAHAAVPGAAATDPAHAAVPGAAATDPAGGAVPAGATAGPAGTGEEAAGPGSTGAGAAEAVAAGGAAGPEPAGAGSTAGPVDAAGSEPGGPTGAEGPHGTEVERPRDDPDGVFELVAANLEWPFDAGRDESDAVDSALVRYAGSSGRLVGLYRTWVGDPDGGWVRVIMAYVGTGSIADVETERSTVVDVLRRSGAKRCCVEVVGVSDLVDVHEWLQDQSVALWDNRSGSTASASIPAPRDPAQDAAAPAATAAPAPSAVPAANAAQPADATPAPDRAAPGGGAAPVPAVAETADGVSGGATTPAMNGAGAARPPVVPAGGAPMAGELPADAVFEAGPSELAQLASLVESAPAQAGLTGLVTVWADLGGQRVLVVGAVVDPDADTDNIRSQVDGHLAGLDTPYRIETLTPGRGLPPLLLRLYRSATRLWSRKVERAVTPKLDTSYHALQRDAGSIIDTSEPLVDEELAGFTLIGIDLNAAVARGEEEPDDRDIAVAAHVRELPTALAVFRGTTKRERDQIVVYAVLVDADADRRSTRDGVAAALAAAGAATGGIEVFCPFERISVLHLNLYERGLMLWKTDQPRPAAEGEQPPGASAETG